MKIFTDRSVVRNTSNNIKNNAANNTGRTSSSEAQTSAKASGFDQILINRTADAKLSDDQFVGMLTKQLSSEVKSGTSPYVLEDLQRQVALNQYDVNVSDIARKLISE